VRVWTGAGREERERAAHDQVGLGLDSRVAVMLYSDSRTQRGVCRTRGTV
jgi:hypothetical protein